ncbi:TIR domain-containing protein [Thiothrix winogradskyi]|uniref:Toll/interleukin-1 receptor domain-containing protein n=1 Tax=Thiothrix winogradskyi TaxID=96472 RepID=A0ABY3T1T6_9GAMM|nr:toll/interleukin-1 receptor domain-containing protein [Thiothrix winogradskyi]UJS25771.1 toll/interleukin-1 receptor domain-containing protein [Thiothrix winogradskyi]
MNQQFDIFLSHNSKDKTVIREIKQWLRERELSCWLDEDELQPGVNWMPLLEKAIATCQSAGAFVSSNGVGPWENEEIQALLSEAVRNKIPVIPVLLPGDYEQPKLPLFLKNRTFIDMRSGLSDEVIDRLIWGVTGKKPQPKIKNVGLKPDLQITPSIHSDRLPTVKGGFFGREAELQLLSDAWSGEENPHPNPSPRGRGAKETITFGIKNTINNPSPRGRGAKETRIIQLIAPGGTGKTKLLRHWLDHTADIPVLIAWSFYSQGSSEDKQTSATPFFSHAFAKLGSTRERFASEEDKGDHLAELLHGKRYVLVLDGLEPLQHGGAAMRGELKDKAIRQLLRQLARHPCGLCIITTRIALHELSDRDAPTVIRHDLQNLSDADGIQLLQSLGVTGSAAELGKAVHEYGGHALALSLLGNVLRLRPQGDVRKRDTLTALVKATGNRDSRHAFKVMQAYAEWFAGEPELALLHLLGLFDHPIGQDVLQMLWDAQIPHLTAGIDEDEWLEAIASLREEHHLLSQHDSGGDLDCHPLIREYFGGQLKTQQPQAWQQAHERLYGYYKALPEKEFPDTLEEMQPLFSAVAHGCAAGLYIRVNNDVYWPRIRREDSNYLCTTLGATSDDLSLIAHFFAVPWHTPVTEIGEDGQALMLNYAGFRLRGLGRLREAFESMQANVEMVVQQENWSEAATGINNLSELQLTLGNIWTAISISQLSVSYANQAGDWAYSAILSTTYADILHQAGQTALALSIFQEAEQLQQEQRSGEPHLYSIQGFRYCDLLLALGKITEVLERVEYSIELAGQNGWLLNIGLDQLTFGRTLVAMDEIPQALLWLERAVICLRSCGVEEYLPLGLLARAALHRHTRDFARARQDLQEVFDIADGSGMRLHLTDYHLEMARLSVAEEENPPQSPFCKGGSQEGAGSVVPPFAKGGLGGISLQAHIEAAAKLINETGYHRRDPELVALQGLTHDR